MAAVKLTPEQEQDLYELNFVIASAAGDEEAFERAVLDKTAYLQSLGLTRADVE